MCLRQGVKESKIWQNHSTFQVLFHLSADWISLIILAKTCKSKLNYMQLNLR